MCRYWCEGLSKDEEPCTVFPGVYCPRGSSSGTGMPCPVGRYCEGGTTLAEHCECEPGNYCPQSSSQAMGDPCPEVLIAAAAAVSYVYVAPVLSWSLFNSSASALCAGARADLTHRCLNDRYLKLARKRKGFYCEGLDVDKEPCTCEVGFYCHVGGSDPAGNICPGGTSGICCHPRAWKCSVLVFGACRFFGWCQCYLRTLTSRCCQGTSAGEVHTSVPHARVPRATSVRKDIMALVRNQAKQSMQPH